MQLAVAKRTESEPGGAVNFAGVLTVDLPDTAKKGQKFEVVVRQITSADGFPNRKQAQPAEVLAAATRLVHPWRTVLGEFNLTIPVSTKHQLLPGEEHLLSIMKWIAKDIPPGNRWYPVFQRYLEQVTLMGGDPRKVVPPGPAFGRSPRNQALGAGMNMVTNIT